MDTSAKTIDEFINKYPEDVQQVLRKVYSTIRNAVPPETTEKISYGIPTFTFHGNLIHFSAYEHHIGLYPGSIGVAGFQDRLKEYDTSKGTIRFPLDKPIPYDLIEDITKYCVEQRLNKAK